VTKSPTISFGLPVRNGGSSLVSTLASLQAQEFRDIEIVVSDNASTDDTQQYMEAAAAADSRIRYHRYQTDQGQIENFNQVFRLARGKYFRWIGCGDRVSTTYAGRCIERLDAADDAVAVTTDYCFIKPDGSKLCASFHGARLEDSSRLRRLQRFLWLTDCDPLYFDPIYSTVRSDVLRGTPLLKIHRDPDHILALELCLAGPFVHIPEYLAERIAPDGDPGAIVAKRYYAGLKHSRTRVMRRYFALARVASKHAGSLREILTSYVYIFFFMARRVRNPLRRYWAGVQGALAR